MAAGAVKDKLYFRKEYDILNTEYFSLQQIITDLTRKRDLLFNKKDLKDDEAADYNKQAQDTQTAVAANNEALKTLLEEIKAAVKEHTQRISDMAASAAAVVTTIAALEQSAQYIATNNPAIAAAAAAAATITAAHTTARGAAARLNNPAEITEQKGQAILDEIRRNEADAKNAKQTLDAAVVAAAAVSIQNFIRKKNQKAKAAAEAKAEELRKAAEAKAAQDVSTAAQALADARNAIQTQIDELNELVKTRNTAFEQELTSKTTHVVHMVQTVIPNKVAGIKGLLQGEHISQATRDIVKGIDTDINDYISKVDFKRIATLFNGKNENEIGAIQGQIDALTKAMSGDINAMKSALASTQLPLSTTLEDFIRDAKAFIGTLDAKLRELDGAEARVNAKIVEDLNTFQEEEAKIKNFQSKIDAVVDSQEITAIIKSIDDKIIDVESKYGEVNKFTATTPQFTKSNGNMKYHTSITNLKAEITKLDNAIYRLLQHESFDNIKEKLNDIQLARTSRGINAPSSISNLNQKIQVFQDNLQNNNNKYQEHIDNHTTISAKLLQSRSSSPLVHPPSSPRSNSAAPRRTVADRASPQEAWVKDQLLKSISIDNEQLGPVDADIVSEPVTPPAPITGARRNFLYVSHNTEPKTAYLVVVKNPRQGGGGGIKNYHIQKGGDPPPVQLPEGSEIFPIDTNNPNFLDVMAGLLPPSELLKVSPDGANENKIISNIRSSGRRPKGDLNTLYQRIKSELITDENQNPLTIGLRAVYYQNIIKLIQLLDNTLNQGRRVHQEMYEKLRKFMDYTYGTFGVLEALFDATLKHNPTSPRPNTPPPPPLKIYAVFNKELIKQIVGWTSNIKNTHFDVLFDNFSIICPNGTKNTFLTDDDPVTQKNLGSKRTGYNQFRLNWIILLAFHSLYIGNTRPETVGELIKALYDAFLGWMATNKDTFERMFRNTLVRQTPAEAYSEQVVKRINYINGNDPTLQPLVKAIKDKLCDLQKIPVNPVNHTNEYDDNKNDREPVPPSQGIESDTDSDNVSESELAVVREEIGRPFPTRGPRTPPEIDDKQQSKTKVPPLTLPLQRGESLGGPQSERTGNTYERRLGTLRSLKNMRVNVGLPAGPASSSSLSGSVSDRPRQTLRLGVVSPFHKDANKKATITGNLFPETTDANYAKQLGSQPAVLSQPSPRNPPSSDVFLRTQRLSASQAAPASTPASTPAAPPQQPPGKVIPVRITPLTKRLLTGPGGERGGNNKKRTRKDKKHTSISASRRPTRRRRNPPTEGHKYTRKRPRT
jgi:hypothetical protein